MKIHERIHIVGIGGIGMSAIAQILKNEGHKVSGSNLNKNQNVENLEAIGIKVFTGQHKPENAHGCDVLVLSSAIPQENPERIYAVENNITVLSRAQCLKHMLEDREIIAVSGSHGKTTTTSMIASILEESKIEFNAIAGGIMNQYKNNAKTGNSKLFLLEADESDGTFTKLSSKPCKISIITSIDYSEHLEYYKTEENLEKEFVKFAEHAQTTILNTSDSNVKQLSQKIDQSKSIFFGKDNNANHLNLISYNNDNSATEFIVDIKGIPDGPHKFSIKYPGIHNVYNAMAAISATLQMHQISIDQIKNGLKNHSGVQRRFTEVGQINGAAIIDDYAHHPTEIIATLRGAQEKEPKKKIIAIVQPHRYTRVRDNFDDYVSISEVEIDVLFFTPVYSAGEKPIKGLESIDILNAMSSINNPNTRIISEKSDLTNTLKPYLNSEYMIIFMGAGNITEWPRYLIEHQKK